MGFAAWSPSLPRPSRIRRAIFSEHEGIIYGAVKRTKKNTLEARPAHAHGGPSVVEAKRVVFPGKKYQIHFYSSRHPAGSHWLYMRPRRTLFESRHSVSQSMLRLAAAAISRQTAESDTCRAQISMSHQRFPAHSPR